MTLAIHPSALAEPREAPMLRQAFIMLTRDKFACAAALFLLAVLFCVFFGDYFFGEYANVIHLGARNAAPFSLGHGWMFFLGGDALGRSMLARVIVGARNTIAVAAAAVACSFLIGVTLGLLAGYRDGWVGNVVMRLADVLMSFPSLLLALIVLYVLDPAPHNVVLVLAVTRVPIYIRITRAEVLEIRERMFVSCARVMGAGSLRIIWRHILPMVLPTLLTVATLEFALVMLSESTLSFLGLGVQPPAFSWGLMVAQGQNYLGIAWWLAFWPGLAITLTATSLNLLANWLRIVTDPVQRWRLDAREEKNG
ncbi:MAG: transporter permease [Herbaspirillum sp.]|nr:transporter permease [Herbaspirillum sp.]